MPENRRKLLGYAMTGGTAALVDIGGFRLLSSVSTPIIVAATCSFCVAAVVNFLLSSRWVFRAPATGGAFLVFFLGASLGLLVNVSVTTFGASYLDLPRTLAKTVGVGTAFLVNFWINANVVFPERSSQ
jgi:putative flippase GtrA